MATTVDTLLVRIEADLKDVNRKLKQFDKNVETTAKKAQRNFNKIGTAVKVVLGAVVVQQLAQAGMAAIKFASSVEEMQSKSSVVFGAFTQDVRNACEIIPREMKENGFIIDEFKSFETKGKIVNNCDILKSFVDCYNFENKETFLYYDEYYIGNYKKKICNSFDTRRKEEKSSWSISNYIKSIWS